MIPNRFLLFLQQVTAPAADFSAADSAYVEVEVLGKTMRTTDVPLSMPVNFSQRITFKRVSKGTT